MNIQNPEFRKEFLDYTRRFRPVDATFIGLHENDTRLPEHSESGLADRISSLDKLEASLRNQDPDRLSPSGRIDQILLQGQLSIDRWELESGRLLDNPSYYTGEAIFGILSLFLADFAPYRERAESARARLDRIPLFLQEARSNLSESPPGWIDRARRECTGAAKFLSEGMPKLAAASGDLETVLLDSSRKAGRAFETFSQEVLRRRAATPMRNNIACGEEALDLLLRQGHFLHLLGFDIQSIAEYANEELRRARGRFETGLKRLGFPSQEDFFAHLSSEHPNPEGYLSRFDEIRNAVRETVQGQELLSWPDFPLQFKPRPKWVRPAAPFLYFLYYRSPAAFDAPSPHHYLVEPIETLESRDQQKVLRSHNQSVIKLNHVIHHGSLGHHVQNWHAARSGSLVGRIGAVDCASRIALFCGGTMAEGWACYATDLMREAGFLSPEEELAEEHGRMRLCARTIVDLEIHCGRMTLEQAAEFYRREVGMSGPAAEREAVKNSMFPATALMYLMGTDAVHQLRRELSKKWGDRFSLKQFHDSFLSFGSIPVALIREAMLSREKQN